MSPYLSDLVLPEFSNTLQRYFTHGDTYAEAIANAEEVLELLIEDYEETGKPLPSPQVLQLA
ncbi:type II toxin-antitoxin system HicB family antitoxin [Pseudanabaena sp. BC1403]|uniref:type II toxin-antitoxin system HicB family antitoxin n=1 Tax=Pseudanabaena sp. BC1403 TaxID=2043171 RepID=UPI000CD84814